MKRGGRRSGWWLALLPLLLLSSGALMSQLVTAAPAPPDKETAAEQRWDQLRADAPVAPKPANPELQAPPDTPEPPWETGIIEDGEAPFSSQDVSVTNRWQAVIGNHHVTVYAGAMGADPSQGVVIVTSQSLDLSDVNGSWYQTPGRDGAVKIVGANLPDLTLQAADGTRLTFDLSSRGFSPA